MKHKKQISYLNASPKVRLWDDSGSNLFAENVCQDKLNNITQRLNNMTKESVSVQEINEIVIQTENLFSSAAKQSFGVKTQTYAEYSPNKKWFNQECRSARNNYHRIRKIYNKNKTVYNKICLKQSVKNTKLQFQKMLKNTKINGLTN